MIEALTLIIGFILGILLDRAMNKISYSTHWMGWDILLYKSPVFDEYYVWVKDKDKSFFLTLDPHKAPNNGAGK